MNDTISIVIAMLAPLITLVLGFVIGVSDTRSEHDTEEETDMTRQDVIARCEKNFESGCGIRLTKEELSLLMARPTPGDEEPEPKIRIDVQIRWLIRRDMTEVLRIEQQSFEFAWTEEDFLCCLRQRNCIGMVAERDHEIVGFMIYELHKSRIGILNFAVDPRFRRRGVGRKMMDVLKRKLSLQRRTELTMEVRDRNLSAQQFLSAMGFKATKILREHYESGEDCYLMRHTVRSAGHQ